MRTKILGGGLVAEYTNQQHEILNNDQTLIDIETGVEYGLAGNPTQAIISDFRRL
jgi:hypothetical protein